MSFSSLGVMLALAAMPPVAAAGGVPGPDPASSTPTGRQAVTARLRNTFAGDGSVGGEKTRLVHGFSVRPDGRTAAMVELVDPPAVRVYLRSMQASAMATGAATGPQAATTQALAAARAQVAHLDQVQREIADVLTTSDIAADLIYRVQRVYNGIAVMVDVAKLDEIRTLPGVKAVHPLVPKHLANFTSVPFIGAPQVWNGSPAGATGAGVKVGVIDTGIDYLHADFGGSGGYRNDGTYVSPNWPKNAKVVGGYDFAGDNYDASGASGSTTPTPDPDPMDCDGHGSHVAGTLAGYGENSDGSTFKGPYNASTPISTLGMGPGVAPDAQLYALKIFGCSGTTNLVTPAIDWAVDPNNDGNFSDHLDVVNLSLGSDYGVPDDPDTQAAENAAAVGVIVVAAGGNSGDAFFDVNSPGNADRAISVGAAGDPGVIYADLRVTSPAAIAGDYAGQPALFGPALPSSPITGSLVYTSPGDGCSALSNKSAVSGNVAFMIRGNCNFTVKVKNAQLAGATAAVIVDNVYEPFLVFMAGTDPTITIPSFSISLLDGLTLEGQLPSPGVSVTVLKVDMADTMANFSSRGPRTGDAALKPDVTAPGLQIFSVAARTTNAGVFLDGTSMATPHVSGVMALLRQLHPTWTVEELKALLMNTAGHNVTVYANATPPYVGAGRVGAGRVDVAAAAASQAVAFDADDPGRVSASFGVLEVSENTTVTKNIVVENKSVTPQTYTLGFTPFATIPGVSVSFPGGADLEVPADSSVTFQIQLTADAALMRHTMDPSLATTGEGFARSWFSEVDGDVTLTPGSGSPLRVPIYAAARPVSAMKSLQPTIGLSGSKGTATLGLAGQGLATGTSYPTDILSLVSPFELLEDNPDFATSDARFLGVTSDYQVQVANGKSLADSMIYFGVTFQQAWSSPVPLVGDIYFDVNGDGKDDYDLFVADFSYLSGNPLYDDVYVATLCNLSTASCTAEPVNGITPDVLDSVPMNTNVIVLPVAVPQLGLTAGHSKFSFYFKRTSGTQVRHSFDPTAPGLSFGGPAAAAGSAQPIFPDRPSTVLTVNYSQSDYTADGAQGILLLHHDNAAGQHAEAVGVSFGSCSVSASPVVPTTAGLGTVVPFQANATASSCAGTPSYDWDFGDGSAHSSDANTAHTYARSGSFTWRLFVADGEFSTTQTGTIRVVNPKIRAPRRVLGR